MTEKAAAVGFDWRRPHDVMAKLHEEVGELETALDGLLAAGADQVRDEMGDVLFVMANLARHLGVEPETALQGTNAKFLRRFRAMEADARARGRTLRELDLAEQDALWEAAKRAEACTE
jgi:ATP diphosphatase